MGGDSDKSFWVTLPGILTGIAAIITAIGGILLALHAIGYFDDSNNIAQETPTSVTPTPESTLTPTLEPNPEPTPTQTQAETSITYPPDSTDFDDSNNIAQETPTSVTPTPESTLTPTLEPTPEPTPTQTQAEINITYPLDSTDVQMKETVKGTATNIPEGRQIWIVTRWYDNYYPQNYVDIQSDGSWELPVQIGEGDSHGSTYDIMAVLADKNAQNDFNNYLNTFEKTGVWPEMRELPDGSKVKAKVIVGRV